jgi:hypothetical protein
MNYQGSCHCGAIKFEAEGELKQVVECNCSYCSRKGTLLWFVPRAQFVLQDGADKLSVYQFNKHRIEHRFCPTCGVQPFAFGKDPSGAEIAAVNARCLENVDLAALTRYQYDGKSA